jgi:hypothetical protein
MRSRFTKHDSALTKPFKRQRLNRLRLSLVGVSTLMELVGLPFQSMASVAAAAPDIAITVRVYDYAQASSTILALAEREAGRIFGDAGLKVEWLDCTPEHSLSVPQDLCQKAIEAEDVRLRIVLAPARNFLHDNVFGFAVRPALATVYYKSALDFAKNDEGEFEFPIVLGCAMAHEIGHLLLGSNRHSVSGVMRAQWEREHIRQALMGALVFTPKQARLMRAEMERRFSVQKAAL